MGRKKPSKAAEVGKGYRGKGGLARNKTREGTKKTVRATRGFKPAFISVSTQVGKHGKSPCPSKDKS